MAERERFLPMEESEMWKAMVQRARMTATQIMMQHRAEQDARTHARKLQQAVDEEGCGAVFAALTQGKAVA